MEYPEEDGEGRARRDVIVVGASMGGVEALTRLAASLPADLPANLFVVQHTSADSPGYLADILDKAGPLPASIAGAYEPVRRGCIYVAPPDRHLLVRDGHVLTAHGPRENRMRPAIDPLFRSAAVSYASRVIGIVLTGLLDDGTSGLDAVKRCGGLAIIQDPEDAAYPDMPTNALAVVKPDYLLPVEEMGALLARLVKEPAPEPPPIPADLQIEVMIAERTMTSLDGEDALGKPSQYTCPECGGSLWEINDEHVRRYRCRVGHAFTANALLADQDHAVEQALWAALRLLEERANMLARMARDEKSRGHERMAAAYEERLAESRTHAESLRTLLLRNAIS